MATYTYRLWKTSCLLTLHRSLCLPLIFLPGGHILTAQANSDYWKQNVAILEMRVRTINPTAYVREIVLLDFNKSEPLAIQFGFGSDLFSDNGLGFDLQSGDGIYTAENSYLHNPNLPYSITCRTQAAGQAIIIDEHFQFKNQLKKTVSMLHHLSGMPDNNRLTECQLKFCSCPGACICFACEWGPAAWCLDWYACNTSISLRW